jgi:hypothetical protein
LGCPHSLPPPYFYRASRIPSTTVPATFAAVHPLLDAASPSEFSGFHPSASFRSQTPSLGSCPLCGINERESTHEKQSQAPLRSARRVSHPLDGFLLGPPCGFISPRNHIRDSPFRGFPSAAAVPPHRRPTPLLPFLCDACYRLAPIAPACTASAPGSCSAAQSVVATQGISLRHYSCPSWALPPPGLPLFALPPPSRKLRSRS